MPVIDRVQLKDLVRKNPLSVCPKIFTGGDMSNKNMDQICDITVSNMYSSQFSIVQKNTYLCRGTVSLRFLFKNPKMLLDAFFISLYPLHFSPPRVFFFSQSCQLSLILHQSRLSSLTAAIPLECSPLVVIECRVCICLELV